MRKLSAKITSFKDWMEKTFDRDEMKDIAAYGVAGGFHHLTYYKDTAALYQKYHDDIWDMLNEDANSMGHKHPLEMMVSFGGAGNVSSRITFENLMVWYAAEKVAHELTET